MSGFTAPHGPKKGPRPLAALMADQTALRKFNRRKGSEIEVSDELRLLIKQQLPPNIADQIQVLSLHKQQLSLAVSDPAAATELRFLENTLLKSLRSRAIVTRITVHVQSDSSTPESDLGAEPRKLPEGTGKQLRQAAGYIKHEGIAEVLLRIAERDPENL